MKVRSITIALLLTGVFLSCQREIGFVFLDQEPMLNVIARFSTQDTVHVVYVSFSSGENLRRPPEGCIVRCLEGESILAETDSVWVGADTYLQGHRLTMKVEPEHEYTLDVTVGEYHASVLAAAPPVYDGKVVLGDTSYVKDGYGCRQFSKINLLLEDIPGQRNYYVVDEYIDGVIHYWKDGERFFSYRPTRELGKVINNPSSWEEGSSPYSPEIGLELGVAPFKTNGGLCFFSDYTFQDGSFLLQGEFDDRPLVMNTIRQLSKPDTYDSVTVEAIFRVGTATAWNYEYMTLLIAAMENSQSFVGEPVILPNRVEGGCGYFEIITMKEMAVDLGEITADINLIMR